MDKLSYALGLGIGTQLAQLGAKDLNLADFMEAVKDMLEGNESKVEQQEAQKLVSEFFQKQEEREMERAARLERARRRQERSILPKTARIRRSSRLLQDFSMRCLCRAAASSQRPLTQ